LEFDRQGSFVSEAVRIKDGREVTLRPARREDRQKIEHMFRSCSSATLYNRFLSPGQGVPMRYLDRLMMHNPPAYFSMVGEVDDGGDKRIVSLLNFVETEPGARGEIAIVVTDEFQNKGLGTAMLRTLYSLAKKRGLKRFIADVDAGNRRVFHLIQKSELPCEFSFEQGVAHAEVVLED